MEQNENVSDVPQDAGSADQEVVQSNPGGSNHTSSDWGKRILGEKKALQSKLKEYEEKVQALQGQQLQSEGKKDEYIQHLETQIAKERETRLDDRATFAHRTLSERLMSEASRMGMCGSCSYSKVS